MSKSKVNSRFLSKLWCHTSAVVLIVEQTMITVWKKQSKKSCIYRRHFELHYHKTGAQRKRYRLVMKLNPVTTILDREESHLSEESKQLMSPVSVPRESPTKRVYQQYQFRLFEEQDKIKSFPDIDAILTPSGYTFPKYDIHVVLNHLKTNFLSVPEVTHCVQVDWELHVKLFYKISFYLYHNDFASEGNVVLREAKLPNLYQMRGETDVQYSRRIQNLIIKKKRIFSSSVIRYSFVLRYISLQTYRLLMKEFPFSSLTLLEKISERQFNARKYTKSLRSQGVI